ncbi:tetratricopeptide repeat-containing glycosyltransferase family 2 protein [Cellulosilyticum ruminicola]|uniref:tetratricopeptide repeat-containing glycosyltransferase family 2 protein n=1 Tax=Cellulosilyticum ruminicola TaxID=425254 RepID=UPI0006CFE182|nr:glycosyltransferase family 2 protein [Cellulosilyticum ruminicola]
MKLSLCIICKNEEKKIARCINSVKEKVDEIIVVDTGSTDETIQIVKKLGAKVFEIPWENDFSKARNYAIDKSKGNWIIFLDADEYLMDMDLKGLRNQILTAENMKGEAIFCNIINENSDSIQNIFKTIRIFKRDPKIRYTGKIHELLNKEDGQIQLVDLADYIRIRHDGYSQDTVVEKNKMDRNLEMLLKEYELNPTSSDLCYYLMETYHGTREFEKAWSFGQKVLEYNNDTLSGIRQNTYNRLLELAPRIKKTSEEIKNLYEEAIQYDNSYPDFDFRYACYLYEQEKYDQVIEYIQVCLEKMETYSGTAASKTMGNLVGVLKILVQSYIVKERFQEAVPLLVKILRIDLYDYTTLYAFIQILDKTESGAAIGEFLCKLYDYTNIKDQMVLLKVVHKIGNLELLEYLMKRANPTVLQKIGLK